MTREMPTNARRIISVAGHCRRPFGVPRVNAIEFLALLLQGFTHCKFHQAQHPHTDTKQAHQTLDTGTPTLTEYAPGVALLGQIKEGYTFAFHMRWMPVILLGLSRQYSGAFLDKCSLFLIESVKEPYQQ